MNHNMTLSVERLAYCYLQACELDILAFKPGNVSQYADGHDMVAADFRRSALASVPAVCNCRYSLGEKIYYAIEATRTAVGCNTNLGIVLLAVPLLHAALAWQPGQTLRQALHRVLLQTTVDDADWAFRAICLAAPAGLGQVERHDVHASAKVTLRTAMDESAIKDRIAYQYLTDYQDIFDFALPTYYNSLNMWRSEIWATVGVYIGLLSRFPYSHIIRKYGEGCATEITNIISMLHIKLQEADYPEQILPMIYKIDRDMKARHINPGTTADLTVATLLVAFLEQEIQQAR